MSRSTWTPLAGLLLALLVGMWWSGRQQTAFPSARSRGPSGLLAARLYLEEKLREEQLRRAPTDDPAAASVGEVWLSDRPVDETFEADWLVTVFPWRRVDLKEEHTALTRWLRQGGTLVIGYSGREQPLEEERFLEAVGLELDTARQAPPLGFLAWRHYQREEWTLLPEGSLDPTLPPLSMRALTRVPRPPTGAEVLYARAGAAASSKPPPGAVFRFSRGQGSVIVVPAQLLGHHRLSESGPSAFWATLVAAGAGQRWVFDEYHQGLVAAEVAKAEVSLLPFDLFFVHLGLAYLLTVWVLVRRFGPAWRELPPRLGSSGSFLLGLGRLHDRWRHHADAARLLLVRAAELDPALARGEPTAGGEIPWSELQRRAETAGRQELVTIAREVARRRAGKT